MYLKSAEDSMKGKVLIQLKPIKLGVDVQAFRVKQCAIVNFDFQTSLSSSTGALNPMRRFTILLHKFEYDIVVCVMCIYVCM